MIAIAIKQRNFMFGLFKKKKENKSNIQFVDLDAKEMMEMSSKREIK
jgi:hypothetical protein